MFSKAVIEPDDVKEALYALAEAHPIRRSNPLLQCLLTLQILHSPDFPRGDYAELQAVYEVLEESFLDLLEPDVKYIRKIRREHFTTENHVLLSYQLLYFRYMRRELGLSTRALAESSGYTERTTRRRLQDGIQYLTLDIIRRETAARQAARQALQSEAFVPDSLFLRKQYPWIIDSLNEPDSVN